MTKELKEWRGVTPETDNSWISLSHSRWPFAGMWTVHRKSMKILHWTNWSCCFLCQELPADFRLMQPSRLAEPERTTPTAARWRKRGSHSGRSNRIASMSTSGVCIVLDWIAALRWELVSLAYTAALPASHTVMMFGDCLVEFGGRTL